MGLPVIVSDAFRRLNPHLFGPAKEHFIPVDKPRMRQNRGPKINKIDRPDDTPGFFEAAGLPRPTPEFSFHPTRKWRFDYAWPEFKLALENEGGIWRGYAKGQAAGAHSHPLNIMRDKEKYSAAAVLGWRIVYCAPETLRTAATVEMIRAALTL